MKRSPKSASKPTPKTLRDEDMVTRQPTDQTGPVAQRVRTGVRSGAIGNARNSGNANNGQS